MFVFVNLAYMQSVRSVKSESDRRKRASLDAVFILIQMTVILFLLCLIFTYLTIQMPIILLFILTLNNQKIITIVLYYGYLSNISITLS